MKNMTTKFTYTMWTVASLICCTAIVSGILITGGPQQQRKMHYDQQRIQSLRSLQSAISSFVMRDNKLPASLGDIQQDKTIYIDVHAFNDPITHEPFVYKPHGDNYELCATFQSSNNKNGYYDWKWVHQKGFHCIYFDVKPQLQRYQLRHRFLRHPN